MSCVFTTVTRTDARCWYFYLTTGFYLMKYRPPHEIIQSLLHRLDCSIAAASCIQIFSQTQNNSNSSPFVTYCLVWRSASSAAVILVAVAPKRRSTWHNRAIRPHTTAGCNTPSWRLSSSTSSLQRDPSSHTLNGYSLSDFWRFYSGHDDGFRYTITGTKTSYYRTTSFNFHSLFFYGRLSGGAIREKMANVADSG